MNGAESVAAAAIFVWLGMVLAISFLEAPLKFRAPGVTLQIGLGIGRLVFGALNAVEAALAAVVVVALVVGAPPVAVIAPAAAAVAALVLANAVAAVPGRWAARTPAAEVMRAE